MGFGRKIKHMMEIRGMNQADLVKATGLHRNTISDLINDKVTNTSTDTIAAISKALRISPAYFFEEHTYTPFEAALPIPDHIKKFLLDLDNLDYLKLAFELGERQISPSAVKRIVDAYQEVYDELIKGNS